MSAGHSDWERSKELARTILRDRAMRRKWMGRWLMATMGWIAAGLWVIEGWLGDNVWRFLIWWGICAGLAVGLMALALYDAVAVAREERE
ncbi:MAG: hypothetical protein H7Y36_05905 [Armatimonadetes bacterium]|nr:hypothetical protein [Akkermansiaceae bacterium]